jgi:hypothetical protein
MIMKLTFCDEQRIYTDRKSGVRRFFHHLSKKRERERTQVCDEI